MGTDVLCGGGDPDRGPYYTVEFLHGHGQVSERNYAEIVAQCPEKDLRTGQNLTPACKAALKQMDDNIGCGICFVLVFLLLLVGCIVLRQLVLV